jgi:aspartate/methionine/tyrosine aminotransferase
MRINDFKLEEYFANYEFKALFLLCASDCESFSIEDLLSLEPESELKLKKLRLGYTESQGNPALREEISNLYENTKSEDILVFAGAEEGIFICMNILLKKGDHIIVQFPAYQSLFEVANSIGCEITKWIMDEKKNWDLDLKFLKDHIKKNTKLIVINNPHNPTGHIMSKEKFNSIIEIAKNHTPPLFIFSDEVYRLLEYNKNDRLPNMCDCYNRGISLGVMSKAFGLAGLRIGWIAVKDKSLIKKLASFKNYTTICSSAPSEFFSLLALRHKDRIIERNLKIILKNLETLDRFFIKNKLLFDWIKPKAGCIAFPKIKLDSGAEKFCLDLFNNRGVLLLPSTKFDFGDHHFRIGYGRKTMLEGLNVLEEYIRKFLD